MKPILHFSFISVSRHYLLRIAILSFFTFGLSNSASSQCGAGYTRDTINWDYLDFLHRSGATYNGSYLGVSFMTAAMAQTQYISLSGNLITYVNTNSCPVGQSGQFYADITTHTGEASTFGVGEDVKFMPAASPATYSMTFTFQNAVQDVKFSVHDIDRLQRIAVTAVDGATAKNINMATLGASILTINNNNTATANVKSANSAVATNVTTGTVNVTIAGSVTAFTITVSETTIVSSGPASGQDDGGFYLSDISACFADPSFPTNYYFNYTQPFTNQPAYILANPKNLSMYMINLSTGVADHIFTDPGTDGQKMNSIAYDPVNHWIYYVMDNYVVPYTVQPPVNRKLKKYDLATGTISTVIADIRTFGIPTFIQGVEFGGASFYNGSLYLGIEGSDGTSYSTGAESIVWKIDFNGSGTPTTYSQVFGYNGDNGAGAPSHDWGDFTIKDGMLYSHATVPTTLSNQFIHYNLQTGTSTIYTGSIASSAAQMGQSYNGTIYTIDSNLFQYNGTGGSALVAPVTITSCSPAWYQPNTKNSAGDGSDPFKPKCDFGDAPSTYDPVALSPAANQKACNNSTLYIGTSWGDEWSKATSSDASGDDEEDGIGTVTTMVSDGVAYNHVQDVSVFNNTGADVYLAAWLDYDADGVFDASEGVVVTVPSSGSAQTITLAWTGITVAIGTPNTFLRVRLYSGTLTANDATGWLADGETEDYPVISSASPLKIDLLDFSASATRNNNVLLKWRAYADGEALGFDIQRSSDQQTWENIGWVDVNTSTFTADYSLLDQQPLTGKSYYRLKMVEKSGSSRYSNTRLVQLDQLITNIKVFPNPVRNDVTVTFNSAINQPSTLHIRTLSGNLTIKKPVSLYQGDNRVTIDMSSLSNGLYIVELKTGDKTFINKLTVSH